MATLIRRTQRNPGPLPQPANQIQKRGSTGKRSDRRLRPFTHLFHERGGAGLQRRSGLPLSFPGHQQRAVPAHYRRTHRICHAGGHHGLARTVGTGSRLPASVRGLGRRKRTPPDDETGQRPDSLPRRSPYGGLRTHQVRPRFREGSHAENLHVRLCRHHHALRHAVARHHGCGTPRGPDSPQIHLPEPERTECPARRFVLDQAGKDIP